MKIAFLSSHADWVLDENSNRTSGGAELQVALLATELAARGVEVVILAGDTGQADHRILRGVHIRNAGRFHTGRLPEMLAAIPRVLRVLREERPDWLFLFGWTSWLALLLKARFQIGCRLGFICGSDSELDGSLRSLHPLRGRLFAWAVKHCDLRLAMTRHQEQLFAAQKLKCGFYRNLILSRSSWDPSEKEVDFLWVSRCQELKQPLLFLELVRRLPHANFEMICPPEEQALFEQVEKEAQALPNLVFRPGVPYHQIQLHYDLARIFVNTSKWEGWPNSFMQAGLGETALLSLKVRPDNLFDDFALGFCADGDFEKLVELAAGMVKNPDETAKMGREAARFVRELHDNGRETEAFLSAIRQVEEPQTG